MRTKLLAGVGTGLGAGLFLMGGLILSLGATAPAVHAATTDDADRVSLCHLQKKVDPSLLFNDGKVITPSKASCAAHCRHGDQPMPVPAGNNAHVNRGCARIHVVSGLPNCEVNTPATIACSLDNCIARCDAS